MSKFAKNNRYVVGINDAFRKAAFLAGPPPLTEWLQHNLHAAYGEKFDEVRAAYLNLILATANTPAHDLTLHGYTSFQTDGDYKRDGRVYNIMFKFAESCQSPAKIGVPYLPLCEALMLRDGMTEGMFTPEERDNRHTVTKLGIKQRIVDCHEMQDWCEEAFNFTELALEHTLYLHLVKDRLRLLKKWTSHHVLGRINPDWGAKHKLSLIDGITDRQWGNATDPATNRAIYKMLDDMTLINMGAKELPFLNVSAQMTTMGDGDAPSNYIHVG